MKLKRILFVGLCLNFINVALSGAALPPLPKISSSPASVNLGSTALGASSAPNVITVKNTGKSDLIINSVITTGTDADEFSQTNNCGTVQPGLSCQVNVVFTPNLPYAKKAAIVAISSNDPKKPLLNVKLSGQVPAPAISATPASVNFGKLPSGTANSLKSVSVKNLGHSDLVINSLDISGADPDDFTATSSDCGPVPVTIPNGTSCIIDVVFAPLVSDAPRGAVLAISSNDPKKSPLSLKLAGSSSSRGPFSQSDLVGTWNMIHFYTGPDVTSGNDPGWLSASATIDASGNVSVGTILTSKGIAPPLTGTIKWTLNSSGMITESGTDAFGPATNLVLSGSKQIVVGTSTDGSQRLIRILVKQDTGAFSAADIASKSLMYNSIASGAGNIWSYGAEETDASGAATMLSQTWPSGAQPGYPKASGTFSVDADGLVTNSSNPDFHGIMTPDKNVIFFVKTNSNGACILGALYISDNHQFNTGDLTGTWYSHSIVSSPTSPVWEHSTLKFAASGSGTASNVVNSHDGTEPTQSISATLSPTGFLTSPDEPSVNGFMSSDKNLIVVTSTWTDGSQYSLNVIIK